MAKDDAVDRISDLPEAIIHHILSYLSTKEVHKTSILSKTFLSWWSSYPVIVLDYSNFTPSYSYCKFRPFTRVDRFEEFNRSLSRNIQLRNAVTELRKFNLNVPVGMLHPETDDCIDEAIDFAVKKQVRELDLNLVNRCFTLPIDTGTFSSITSLKLTGLKLNSFNHVIACCPLIERLCICKCSDLKLFAFSSTTIRSIELKQCRGLQSIKIVSTSLETFIYDGLLALARYNSCDGAFDINISECKSLKALSLASAIITDTWVTDYVPLFVKLEDLRFIRCGWLHETRISNENLKSVTITTVTDRERTFSQKYLEIVGRSIETINFNGCSRCEIEFDAPQLVSFVYNAENPNHWSFHRHQTDSDATLSIQAGDNLPKKHFIILRDFIKCFGSCKDLTLICNFEENLVFPTSLRGREIYPNYHLEHLKIVELSSISTQLVDSLLWLSPNLRTMCFVADEVERLIEFRYDEEMKENDSPKCCFGLRRKCWRHGFKTIEMKNFDKVDGNNLREYFVKNGKVVRTMD